jgi:hypothetical protein
MHQSKVFAAWATILLVAGLVASCGSGHELHSLSITPSTADAKNFSNGAVQFTAMGSYGSGQPIVANALWWTFTPWTVPPPSDAPTPPTPPTFSITAEGVATCFGVGTFTLWATAPANQNEPISQMTQHTAQVSATAQLTCP